MYLALFNKRHYTGSTSLRDPAPQPNQSGTCMKLFLIIPLALACLYLGLATLLTLTDAPSQAPATPSGGLDFASIADSPQHPLPEQQFYQARDGANLPFRSYGELANAPRILVLAHGSGWHGAQFNTMATALAETGKTAVIVPDLRGHGIEPERRGDIDYIAQYEDDLADLIAMLQTVRPDAEIVLGGHSSGGGLVVRFAGGTHGALADRFVLLAPFLGETATTSRPDSGGWAQVAIRRIIGLVLFNQIGITALNGLPVISFAFPQAVLDGPQGHTATTSYSYRLNTGYSPRRDLAADLSAMQQPFLLLAGANDEAFYADAYQALVSTHTSAGTYVIVPDLGHLDLVESPKATEILAQWLAPDP